MVLTPLDGVICEATSLILPSSISTAAGESTCPERGSSRWPARTSSAAALILAIVTLHRIEKLRGVVSDAVFENDFDVLDIGNARGRIAFDHDEVGVLSDGDRSDPILPA